MPKDISILVVDDIENMRKLIASMLFKLKYKSIVTAVDGRDAWNKLKEGGINLVISDWNMPQMSGLDLLKAIRADPSMSKMPVLLVTAEAVKENIMAAAQQGVNDYIVKPFSPATLEEKIEEILSKL